jgi:hypothetical protein
MAVWEDHLLPLLTCKDAARLGCTCKALRGVVREHFRGDLGSRSSEEAAGGADDLPEGAIGDAAAMAAGAGGAGRRRRWWSGCARGAGGGTSTMTW